MTMRIEDHSVPLKLCFGYRGIVLVSGWVGNGFGAVIVVMLERFGKNTEQ